MHAAPSTILHYVGSRDHGPLASFIEAALGCPDADSVAYLVELCRSNPGLPSLLDPPSGADWVRAAVARVIRNYGDTSTGLPGCHGAYGDFAHFMSILGLIVTGTTVAAGMLLRERPLALSTRPTQLASRAMFDAAHYE